MSSNRTCGKPSPILAIAVSTELYTWRQTIPGAWFRKKDRPWRTSSSSSTMPVVRSDMETIASLVAAGLAAQATQTSSPAGPKCAGARRSHRDFQGRKTAAGRSIREFDFPAHGAGPAHHAGDAVASAPRRRPVRVLAFAVVADRQNQHARGQVQLRFHRRGAGMARDVVNRFLENQQHVAADIRRNLGAANRD